MTTETYSVLAAFFFAASHILIRRGLATSNALTASLISLGMTALTLWILAPFFVPLEAFKTYALGYFIAAGIFAPGLGRIMVYTGIERLGVARSVPIANSSPMFASIIAVLFLGEVWTLQNVFGTILVILGVILLSRSQPEQREWRVGDLLFPTIAALSFGISSNLRRYGLTVINIPLMAAAVTATTSIFFAAGLVWSRGGRKALTLSQQSLIWFFAAGGANTAATLSVFFALSHGPVVIVEPLVAANPLLSILLSAIFLRDMETVNTRVVIGGILTVLGTILVVTL